MSREPLPNLAPPTDDARLRAELIALQKQQWEALDRATYFGMSAREAQEYDCRARRITELQRALGINRNVPMTFPREELEFLAWRTPAEHSASVYRTDLCPKTNSGDAELSRP
jgi:hypothetical protein